MPKPSTRGRVASQISFWRPPALFLFFLVCLLLAENTVSNTFSRCVSDYAAPHGSNQNGWGHQIIFVFIPSQIVCSARWIDKHNGLIAALAGAAVSLFTYTLWRSTEKLWNSSDRQLAHLKNSSERQLRAYVLVENVRFERPNGEEGRSVIVVILKNFGTTPCYQGVLRLEADICQTKPRDFLIPFTERAERHDNVIIAPGHFHTVTLDRSEEVSGAGQWQARRKAGHCAYVWGRFDYIDAFGKAHYMKFQQFCPFFDSPSFGMSKVGNDAD